MIQLLKKIRTRKISVDVEDVNWKKKFVKEIIRLDDDDKEIYEKFVLGDNDAKEYFNEEDMNVGSKIESKIEKEDGVWMHTQTVELMKKDGSYSSKKKSTSDLSEIIDFEVNNKILIKLSLLLKIKTGKRNIRKLHIEKKFKKKNQKRSNWIFWWRWYGWRK